MRSRRAAAILRAQGMRNVRSMRGGINAWNGSVL
ncbi:rhodanese-like domain-containing protein [Massilia sp. B-10]|nr:rhodanese-like domain-containing protein [Massilia sp. B-10]